MPAPISVSSDLLLEHAHVAHAGPQQEKGGREAAQSTTDDCDARAHTAQPTRRAGRPRKRPAGEAVVLYGVVAESVNTRVLP